MLNRLNFQTVEEYIAAMRKINSFRNYEVPKIGCCGIVPASGNRVLAIDCAKGRGLVLPGGKFDIIKDLTYKTCAAREVHEETGVLVNNEGSRLIHNGLCFDGYHVYFFRFPSYQYEELLPNREGIPQFVTVEELIEGSMYAADYHLLFGSL